MSEETVNYDALFAGFGDADPTGKGPKIHVEAECVVRIEEIRLVPSKNPRTRGHTFFIAQFTILETDNEKVVVDRVYTWSNDLMNEFFGLGNVKQLLAAVLGFKSASDEAKMLDKGHIKEALEEDSLIGETVRLATNPRSEDAEFPFTEHTWSPYVEVGAA